jgi:hypothetical protein
MDDSQDVDAVWSFVLLLRSNQAAKAKVPLRIVSLTTVAGSGIGVSGFDMMQRLQKLPAEIPRSCKAMLELFLKCQPLKKPTINTAQDSAKGFVAVLWRSRCDNLGNCGNC